LSKLPTVFAVENSPLDCQGLADPHRENTPVRTPVPSLSTTQSRPAATPSRRFRRQWFPDGLSAETPEVFRGSLTGITSVPIDLQSVVDDHW